MMTKPARTLESAAESSFKTHDGTEIFYRLWRSSATIPKGAVILLHRGHEHSGRVAHLVEELGLDDYDFYAWDARGHGKSPGVRGYSPSFAASVRDLDCFARHVCDSSGFDIEDVAVIAQSVGAVLASAWVHDYAPKIRALGLPSDRPTDVSYFTRLTGYELARIRMPSEAEKQAIVAQSPATHQVPEPILRSNQL